MWTTNPELAKLLANHEDGYRYMQQSNKRVDWICPICNEVIKSKKINDVYYDGVGCRKCADGISYPNKLMFNMLKYLNIKFESEVKFEWAKNYKYDFYIFNTKYIIEMDGRFHENVDTSNSDIVKNKLAKENGFTLIRIDCYYNTIKDRLKYIKHSIIESGLLKHLECTKEEINWDYIDNESKMSFVKQACDLWNDGVNSTVKISKLLGINRATVNKYLKRCALYGWCNYDPKDSYHKTIICVEKNTVYTSIKEASELLEIQRNCIGNCLRGLSKTAGGFHWTYHIN
jgi:very-short-patch-repair endonuclease